MDEGEVNVKIVIGRTNPPHAGHIKLMTAAINAAHTAPGPIKCALILLGNGPEGQRTNEDPIDHDTKSAFLRNKLSAVRFKPGEEGEEGAYFSDGVDFVVMRMNTSDEGGPSKNISDFLAHYSIGLDNTGLIRIVQFTGDKPGKISITGKIGPSDPQKHKKLRLSIQRRIKEQYNLANVTCDVEPVESAIIVGETPMSATKVREDAVECFSAAGTGGAAADSGHACWMVKYPFYNGDPETVRLSKLMFDAIIHFKDTPHKKTKKTPTDSGTKRSVRTEDDPAPAFVKTLTAKPDPTSGRGGSRRKHTRRHLRIKKTLRTNRRHNKHRHTRRRN